ncbi:putative short-chain dehydrogenase [Aulographum hederae CBS 113979]|uniref:Putative short-chain dehydrogenase n=1 Tax=Aulographum hederae CBS 113979 TaxID=1176131 RepID=A0A6G1GX75_9PEZI|nr:putative short-chain dehydrogenase [Aulographum hederae CBS 113979]
MSSRLQNKVALVTGSSSGIGRAIALAFAANGAKLIVCVDLNEFPRSDGIEDDERPTAKLMCDTYGDGRAIFVRVDVSISEDVKHAVDVAVEEGGRLDIIVNNAGIGESHDTPRLHEMDDSVWDKTMAVNARGVFLGCKYAIGQFMKQEPIAPSEARGWVINIASVYGMTGAPGGHGPYCASKGAVLNFTKQIAVDYSKDKIHANAVCPGHTRSAMTSGKHADPEKSNPILGQIPCGRWGEPSDIANACVFLASDDAAYISGIGLPVDGGFLAM